MHEDCDLSGTELDTYVLESDSSIVNSDIEAALYGMIYHVPDTPDLDVSNTSKSDLKEEKIEIINISDSEDSDVKIVCEENVPNVVKLNRSKAIKRKKKRNDSLTELNIIFPPAKRRKIKLNNIESLPSSEKSIKRCFEKPFVISISPERENDNFDSDKSGEWHIDLKDKKHGLGKTSRYFNSNRHRRKNDSTDYFLKKKITCVLCGKNHSTIKCSQKVCLICGDFGHFQDSCEYYASRCSRCNMRNHQEQICPDLWRQYYLTTQLQNVIQGSNEKQIRVYCYNCGTKGHFGHCCKRKRMDSYIFPHSPFIVTYDNHLFVKPQKGYAQKIIGRKENQVETVKPCQSQQVVKKIKAKLEPYLETLIPCKSQQMVKKIKAKSKSHLETVRPCKLQQVIKNIKAKSDPHLETVTPCKSQQLVKKIKAKSEPYLKTSKAIIKQTLPIIKQTLPKMNTSNSHLRFSEDGSVIHFDAVSCSYESEIDDNFLNIMQVNCSNGFIKKTNSQKKKRLKKKKHRAQKT